MKHPRLRGEGSPFRDSLGSQWETPPLTRGRQWSPGCRGRYAGNTPAYAGKTRRLGCIAILSRKHPRLRGEDCTRETCPRRKLETPPLTRGRLADLEIAADEGRNTPAYAGKTRFPSHDIRSRGKHPRLRGEDRSLQEQRRDLSETPPLTRGRLNCAIPEDAAHGNTPAYAGKTGLKKLHRRTNQKHPRLRGEDLNLHITKTPVLETPPLTRGRRGGGDCDAGTGQKHPRLRGEDPPLEIVEVYRPETPPLTRGRRDGELGREHGPGNTPAYAGKTLPPLHGLDLVKKHPRLRGEDSGKSCFTTQSMETPPLTRGRPGLSKPFGFLEGNTPAYAGKTFASLCSRQSTRKHPRLRGEDRESTAARPSLSGNTPAYAGKTSVADGMPDVVGKHPRLRGEDQDGAYRPGYKSETPPLTRGRLWPASAPIADDGNTPAYAGKTSRCARW